MLYLNENNIMQVGINWKEAMKVIEEAVRCIKNEDYAQPVKPYLRYRNLKNRIIAMPAFVGGSTNIAGIKWIASFPDNIYKGIARSHSVVILNDAETGEIEAIFNTALISIIRTTSVSGLMLSYYDKAKMRGNINIGITGWGPIGQYHYKICKEIFGDRISKVFLFDKRPVIDYDSEVINNDPKIVLCECWEQAYEESDVFISCTVSDQTYIDKKPKKGAFLINVSLRDYKPNIYPYVKDSIIVDDWEEVCRENTDIEVFHKEKGLERKMVKTIVDVVCHDCLKSYKAEENVMFNPMGMAVFDIAIAKYYLNKSKELNMGIKLD
jgi:2,3-diaminopropionate biosynthesis protein SbnB